MELWDWRARRKGAALAAGGVALVASGFVLAQGGAAGGFDSFLETVRLSSPTVQGAGPIEVLSETEFHASGVASGSSEASSPAGSRSSEAIAPGAPLIPAFIDEPEPGTAANEQPAGGSVSGDLGIAIDGSDGGASTDGGGSLDLPDGTTIDLSLSGDLGGGSVSGSAGIGVHSGLTDSGVNVGLGVDADAVAGDAAVDLDVDASVVGEDVGISIDGGADGAAVDVNLGDISVGVSTDGGVETDQDPVAPIEGVVDGVLGGLFGD